MRPSRNKQHDARAASLRRIAVDLRSEARAMRFKASRPNTDRVYYEGISQALVASARCHDAEAKRLRAMR